MRRLHRGWLAAPLLLLATGCGSGGSDAAPPPAVLAPPPDLVVSQGASVAVTVGDHDPDQVQDPAALDVLVLGVDGADAPGLDAAVSTLLGRPDVRVVVMAASDGPAAGLTMSGFPALALDDLDAVLAGTDAIARPDLVVIGITETQMLGPDGHATAAASAARQAAAAGIPSLVVTADASEPDFAAAAMELGDLFDYDLDRLLAGPAGWVLVVPTCPSGLVRDRVEVPIARDARPVDVDCVTTQPEAPRDDVEAHAQGFVTLAELVPG